MNRLAPASLKAVPEMIQVLEAIPDAVVVIDTDLNVRFVNEAFTILAGAQAQSIALMILAGTNF